MLRFLTSLVVREIQFKKQILSTNQIGGKNVNNRYPVLSRIWKNGHVSTLVRKKYHNSGCQYVWHFDLVMIILIYSENDITLQFF